MAAPTYYPLWASDDTTLPATGETNKIRPKTTLRSTGWDKGQIPSAEELNWQLNNIGLWINYLSTEALPTYLPITGTKITLTGEVTGTGTFAGTDALSIAATVTTSAVTSASSIVRRDSTGRIFAYALVAKPNVASVDSSVIMQNSAGSTTGEIVSSYSTTSGLIFNRYTPGSTTVACTLVLYDAGYVGMTYPRSLSTQETNAASLVRYDTLQSNVSSINTSITTLSNTVASNQTAMTTYVNGRSTASLATNGYHKDVNTGFIQQWGYISIDAMTVNSGYERYATITLPTAFASAALNANATVKVTTASANSDIWAQVVSITTTTITVQTQGAGQETYDYIDGVYWEVKGH